MSNDRFSNNLPKFIQPSKSIVAPIVRRDNAPAKAIRAIRATSAEEVNMFVAKTGSLNLATFGGKKPVKSKPVTINSRETKTPAKPPSTLFTITVKLDPSFICTDEEFIKRTRSLDLLSEEAKNLFYNNGGADTIDNYTTYAQAFEALRRHKLAVIKGLQAATAPYRQVASAPAQETKAYVAGAPAAANHARELAREDAKRRSENENWIRQPIERRQA